MVKEYLGFDEIPKPDDSADALALCLSYFLTYGDAN